MAKLRMKISISLDGFVAGANHSIKDPLGQGGMRLHYWAFALDEWRRMHGQSGGVVNESSKVVEESLANIGATIMGRNMFGGPGDSEWKGWWGENPPFHHPVFVLTHQSRVPLHLEGGNSFTFVTEGIESALDQARRAAGGKDVAGGGLVSNISLPDWWTRWSSTWCQSFSAQASGCSTEWTMTCTGLR